MVSVTSVIGAIGGNGGSVNDDCARVPSFPAVEITRKSKLEMLMLKAKISRNLTCSLLVYPHSPVNKTLRLRKSGNAPHGFWRVGIRLKLR